MNNLVAVFSCVVALSGDPAAQSVATRPEPAAVRRALAFLNREVPRWTRENKCYSCHNNGDAARALYTARRLGLRVDDKALADTTRWLRRPDGWKHNGGEGDFSDKQLAAIQFAAALSVAVNAGIIKEADPLQRAAELVAAYQKPDGSWAVNASGTIGSPATYGNTLATAMALRVLISVDDPRLAPRLARAARWLRVQEPETVLDAAATLYGLGDDTDLAALDQRRRCLEIVRRGQQHGGGWGPYLISRAEPFDTAVVLLALAELRDDDVNQRMIAPGRRYLVESQDDDGGWPATTRPAGAESYAQRVSTSAWATLALFATSRTAAVPTKNPAPR